MRPSFTSSLVPRLTDPYAALGYCVPCPSAAIHGASAAQCRLFWNARQAYRSARGGLEQEVCGAPQPLTLASPALLAAPLPWSTAAPSSPSDAAPTLRLSDPNEELVTLRNASTLLLLLACSGALLAQSDGADLSAAAAALSAFALSDGSAEPSVAGDEEALDGVVDRAAAFEWWQSALASDPAQQRMKAELGVDALPFDLPPWTSPDLAPLVAEGQRLQSDSAASAAASKAAERDEADFAEAFAVSNAAVEAAALSLPSPRALLLDEAHWWHVPSAFTESLHPRLPELPRLPALPGASSQPSLPTLPPSLSAAAARMELPPPALSATLSADESLLSASLFSFPSSTEGVAKRTVALRELLQRQLLVAAPTQAVSRILQWQGDDSRRWATAPAADLGNRGVLWSRLGAGVPALPGTGGLTGIPLQGLLLRRASTTLGTSTTLLSPGSVTPTTPTTNNSKSQG